MPRSLKRNRVVSGLDLGQVRDFTAWVVIERTSTRPHFSTTAWEHQTAVRHLERFPPGTAYTEIFESIKSRFTDPTLQGTTMVVDQTGVGKPVIDLLRKTHIGSTNQMVTLTIGQEGHDGHGGWLVPKKDLVGLLQVMFQNRELKVPSTLPDASTLIDELTRFEAKTQLASDTPDLAWRDRPHDDLVLALALACWQSERCWVNDEWLEHACAPRAHGGFNSWGW